VPGRFPIYTDADVHQPLIEALQRRGWDVVRAIDLYPEGTRDEVHFERAAKENRVLITNDRRIEAMANRWLGEGRPFRGLILWPQRHYKRMSVGALIAQIEVLAEPFAHCVIHLKPGR
jgi:predicted nuclease of predicted toxin-antitoxin system